jgi:hypothetical protein
MDEMTEEKEKKVARFSRDDPKKILERDRIIVSELRRENEELKLELEKLLKNNQEFAKLVEALEEKLDKLTEDMKKSYVYSYEKGGWVEEGALERGKIEIAPSMLSVDTINNQLAEILRMIRKHRINV